MVGRFAELCRRRLKVNTGKSKVMVMIGEEGSECEVHVDGIHLEHVGEFKYLGCVLDESGTAGAECSRKVKSGRKVEGAIMSLINARDLQLECSKVLHETLLAPVFMYGSETMLWKEKERYRTRALQMDILIELLGIRRVDRVPNARMWKLCEVKRGIDKRIDEVMMR